MSRSQKHRRPMNNTLVPDKRMMHKMPCARAGLFLRTSPPCPNTRVMMNLRVSAINHSFPVLWLLKSSMIPLIDISKAAVPYSTEPLHESAYYE